MFKLFGYETVYLHQKQAWILEIQIDTNITHVNSSFVSRIFLYVFLQFFRFFHSLPSSAILNTLSAPTKLLFCETIRTDGLAHDNKTDRVTPYENDYESNDPAILLAYREPSPMVQ